MITETLSLIMRQSELMDRIDKSRCKICRLLDKNDHERLFIESENVERLLNIFTYTYKKIDQNFSQFLSPISQINDIVDIADSWFKETNCFIKKTHEFNQDLIIWLETNKKTVISEISRLRKGRKLLNSYSSQNVK